jgi:hypothetical protein
MLDFFNQIIASSLGVSGIIFLLRQECIKNFDKIDDNLGHDWFLIQSHIWSNNVKNTVWDLSTFINSEFDEYKKNRSDDPFTDIFSQATKLRLLTSRLNELTSSFLSYNEFNDILGKYSDANSILKKWIEFSLIGSLSFTIWSLCGIYFEFKNLTIYSDYLDYSLYLLIIIFFFILVKTGYSYVQVERMKWRIRDERARYSSVIQVSNHV